ncbi:NAD(P)-dependent dehydrogenase (short-subunit alcohol dehydrogenase family) [Chitinophaga terrae (ex Kim and Jung 2007)]|jgi:NAD(P)-dependent dehydrogenase (short-subunit alcohol dehydrogenase family)|uniref:glucose 1-dehydrogenase n=1 Tax=Chitinophaga terrae (ex Kim and Jung 2007) TaxID=408074 RepID=UPI00278390B8|nr:glucose 1-dehydrogenase [Chitinophaga terrae (ex Kim and Jung 2007)]MDQ0110011.1 NAD(P)-dependent dehydrogenase (short-subunit alcohol dehydrogenase family) [Chitinophaga terrae (ex Kim and Jung 2007)]
MALLSKKVAVITGGNSGIGYATAADFVAQGARVIITGRNREAIENAARELGREVEGVTADQGRIKDAEELAWFINDRYGKIDILFVNAGIPGNLGAFSAVTEEDFDEVMNVNTKGAFFLIQKLLPHMRDGGTIILLSSISADSGMPGAVVYNASKAALNALGRTLSRELASRRIRVNIVNPGPVETPFLSKANVPAEVTAGMSMDKVPMGRAGSPAEIAKLVTFLASDNAQFITGAAYNIDGGLSVHPLLG